jgi:RIO kinase 1
LSKRYDSEVDKIDDKAHRNRQIVKDKEIYSTVETVFDEKTRMILFKFIQDGKFNGIEGSISTGKEANVYYCSGDPPIACKIYRIESPSFQKMKQYVEGDYRFKKYKQSRVGFITAWAKKEFKNLKKMIEIGISAPRPLEVNRNVLLLEFLGSGESVLPKLIEAEIEKPGKLYKAVLDDMKKLYREAKLVHGDLSAFNILFDESTQIHYIIDVSQSVLNSHPSAEEFLLRDIFNINNFFQSQGVNVIEISKVYEWIVGEIADEGNVLRILNEDFK